MTVIKQFRWKNTIGQFERFECQNDSARVIYVLASLLNDVEVAANSVDARFQNFIDNQQKDWSTEFSDLFNSSMIFTFTDVATGFQGKP